MILGIFIVAGAVFAGFQIGKRQVPKEIPIDSQPAPSPVQTMASPTASPTNNTQANLPANWTFTNGDSCKMKFPIPPLTKDSENRKWTIESDSKYDFLGYFVGASDRLMHRNQEEASGFISGMVSVICGKNSPGTSTEKLFSDFHTYLGVEAAKTDTSEAVIELTSANDITLWDRQVKEFTIVGGMFDPSQKYYFFADNAQWYLVTKKSDSSSKEINTQTIEIFKLLEFGK